MGNPFKAPKPPTPVLAPQPEPVVVAPAPVEQVVEQARTARAAADRPGVGQQAATQRAAVLGQTVGGEEEQAGTRTRKRVLGV